MSGAPADGSVLVLRALGLGDALTGVAALRGVRRAWPDRELWLAGPAATGDWLRDLGVVDHVLPAAGLDPLTWPGRGHVAVDLHGRGPQSHRVLQATGPEHLVAFGCPEADHDGPAWRQDEHEVDRWCRLVTATGGPCGAEDLRLRGAAVLAAAGEPADPGECRGEVLLHPGAASASRRWPAARWARLAACLRDDGRDVAVTGGPAERDLCAAVAGEAGVRDLSGRFTVPGLAARVARAALVVCGDTGVAHVATAVATPSVLLFGPTPPQRWGPRIDPDLHRVVWHGEASRAGDPHGDRLDPALAAVGVGEVLAAARDLLDAQPAAAGGAATVRA